jgi:predicted nucleic-acid-binding Zn-ribbon protein
VILLLAGVGFAIHAALGMLIITMSLLCMVCAFTVLAVRARCPRCKTKWWDNTFIAATTGKTLRSMLDPDCTGNETEELKCRHCGLEIGPHLNRGKPNTSLHGSTESRASASSSAP